MRKSRRNEIYKAALDDVEKRSWNGVGLCCKLRKFTTENEPDPYTNMSAFPEIRKHRPPHIDKIGYWFDLSSDGQKIREQILRQAIRETNPKTNGIRRTSKRASVSSSRKKSK